MENNEQEYKTPRWKRGVMIALCAFLALVLFVMIFATAYVHYLLGHLNYVDPSNESTLSASQAIEIMMTDPDRETIDPTSSETFVHIDDITFPTEPPAPTEPQPSQPVQPTEPPVYGDHLVNILLVGQDRRAGQARQRSDSMILASFNKSTGAITLTSFMRDSYVQIPGYGPNKLNAAYAFGGMKLLSQTLLLNFGVQVDGVVEVDFNGFKDVIDLLGGVDISMTRAEVEYLNACTDWNLSVGTNRLNGEQALFYARLREIDSDYRRAERQRNVLTALINRYKSQSLSQILGLMDDILPLVTTNMTNSEIIGYATEMFPMLAGARVNTLRIPVDGSFDQGYVMVSSGYRSWYQYNIDFAVNKQILMEIFKKAS